MEPGRKVGIQSEEGLSGGSRAAHEGCSKLLAGGSINFGDPGTVVGDVPGMHREANKPR